MTWCPIRYEITRPIRIGNSPLPLVEYRFPMSGPPVVNLVHRLLRCPGSPGSGPGVGWGWAVVVVVAEKKRGEAAGAAEVRCHPLRWGA